MIVPPAEGARFFSPVQAGERFLALGLDGPDAVLVEVNRDGGIRPVTRVPIGEPAGELPTAGLSLTASPDGSRAIVGSSAGLRAISLADAAEVSLVNGRWAAWYAPPVAMAVVSPPQPLPYATPNLTPTARPGPTAAPAGDTDLTGSVVTCVPGQELIVRVVNNGTRTLDRDVFMTVKSVANGFTRVGTTNIGLSGLRPGQSQDIRSTYIVSNEAVQFVIEYPRDTRADNNAITCSP
jgi:hypothetical protein